MSKQIELKNGDLAYGPYDDGELEIEWESPKFRLFLTKQDLLEMLKMFEGEE